MQRSHWLALACLTIASLVLGAEAKEVAALQGKWKLTTVEVSERDAELPRDLPLLEIKDEKLLYGPETLATLVVVAGTNPQTIDLQFREPARTYEGIFAVEGDTLRICLNQVTDGAKERPAELATEDHPNFRLLTFKRASADDELAVRGFVGMVLKRDDDGKGIVIADLVPDSPAKKSDLREGDLLVAVDGVAATDLVATVEAVRKVKPGRDIALTVWRDDKEQKITVTAGVFPWRFFGVLE